MGIRFRKTKKILPGVRLNLGAKSAGITFGPRGLTHTISTTGRRTSNVGIPGSGLSFSSTNSGSSRSSGTVGAQAASAEYYERPTSKRSRTVALLLCVFLGFFGAHRFYVGKKTTGVIWLLTAGLFGIGWLVDMFMVGFGGLYDCDGAVVRSWRVKKIAPEGYEAENEQ